MDLTLGSAKACCFVYSVQGDITLDLNFLFFGDDMNLLLFDVLMLDVVMFDVVMFELVLVVE